MKKIKLTLPLLLLFSASFSQLSLGIASSYNPTKITGSGTASRLQPGLTIGLYGEWRLGNRISVQPEISYAEKNVAVGTDFKTIYAETAAAAFSQNASLYYLNLPLLVSYRVAGNWSVNAGAQYGYRLNSLEQLVSGNRSAFTRQDLGLVGGTQVQLGALKLFGRYVHGISNVNNVNAAYPWRSRSLELGAGLRFFSR